jgi:hypothetical protein
MSHLFFIMGGQLISLVRDGGGEGGGGYFHAVNRGLDIVEKESAVQNMLNILNTD